MTIPKPSKITPQPGILDIELYVGGLSHVDGVADVLKLSSNENPFGPPEAAMTAIARTARDLHRYPSTDHASLRAAIGAHQGLPPEQIICGVGSDEIITFLCQAYAGPGQEVIYTEHGFGMYRISALAAGATPICVAEKARVVDVDAILAACSDKTRLVFIANPANPTGTMIDLETAARLADGLPPQAILVLDGAYAEFVEDYDGGAVLVASRENVVMTRTFSKLYGLGGLRVGWGYAPQGIIDVLNRIRGPFNLSAPALAAAEAAINDADFLTRARSENARMRAWLTQALREVDLKVDPSFANFVLARFETTAAAEGCESHLRANGILVRKVAGYGLPNALRITVGDEAGCRRVVHGISQFQALSAENGG